MFDQARRIDSAVLQVLAVAGVGAVIALLVGNAPPFLAVGAALGLLTLVLFLQRPDYALLGVLLVRASSDLSVVFQRTTGFGILQSGSSNVVLIGLLVVAGGLFVLARGIPLLGLPAGRLILLLLLVGLLAAYRSDSRLLSLSEWVPVLAGFIAYSLAAYLFRTPRAIRTALDVIAASFVVPAAVGFYQLIRHEGVVVAAFERPRVTGTFVHPNPFGFYLVIMLALFISQALTQQGRRKVLALVGSGAAGVLLLATFTRVAWAGALVVVLVIAFYRSRLLLLTVPVMGLLAVLMIPPLAERFADPLGGSLADRFTRLWPATIGAWLAETGAEPAPLSVAVSRLTGLGPGMGLLLAERGGYFRLSPAHNDYLRVLVDYGVFGLLMFVAITIVMIVFGYRALHGARTLDPFLASVALVFFSLSLAFPLMSLTDNVFGYTANQLYFWVFGGLAVAVHHLSRTDSRDDRSQEASLNPRG